MITQAEVMEERKPEIWDEVTQNTKPPNGVTKARIEKVKPHIMEDHFFWVELVTRNYLIVNNVAQLKERHRGTYDVMVIKFWEGITKRMYRLGILRQK
jgi:hypothetical protein